MGILISSIFKLSTIIVTNNIKFNGKFTLIFLLFLVSLFFNVSELDAYDELEQIMIMTREFKTYRRVVLEIPSNTKMGEKPLAEINRDKSIGMFEIKVSNIDASLYGGSNILRDSGDCPVRLEIMYPDSNSLLIVGKTASFEKLVGYDVIGEGKFIFDIYKSVPPKAVSLQESFVTGNMESNVEKNGGGESTKPELPPEVIDENIDKIYKTNLKYQLANAIAVSTIVFAFIVIITSVFLIWRDNKDKPKLDLRVKGSEIFKSLVDRIRKPTLQQVDDNITSLRGNDVEKNLPSFDRREELVKNLVELKNVPYDEAVILANMHSKRKEINVTA